ncbi:MAG: KH domain-containing protein [Ardenticatenaceae bacterium]|nr:KH domain-containing protein [Anaerolineales bacterium]MCB8916447.1 KH domain-containing protein [Ardenticatenaceae bacterium]
MKELVEYIAKSLVDHPEAVKVIEIEGKSATILELSVAESDMGRVIGKGGRVVNAIRTLVQVMAAKQDKRVTLEIV